MVRKDGALFGPHAVYGDKTRAKSTSPQRATLNESTGKFEYRDRTKPSVPKRDDKPILGIQSNKNFVTTNAVEAILMVPRSTKKKELNYLEKEDYGKPPEYLKFVKEEIRRENEMIDKYIKEQMGYREKEPDRYEEMSEEEKEELLYKLKLKWESVNREYQKITHLVNLDTIGQVRRKETMENELKQLESDIDRLQRAGTVLVAP